MNNRSEQEFVIAEKDTGPDKFPVLAPLNNRPAQTNNQVKVVVRATEPAPAPQALQPLDNSGLAVLNDALSTGKRGTGRSINADNRRGDSGRSRGAGNTDGSGSLAMRNPLDGQRGADGKHVIGSGYSSEKLEVILPEGAQQSGGSRGQTRQRERPGTSQRQPQSVRLEPLNQRNIDGGQPRGPRFISFGVDKATDLQYQGLLSKILNYGMLSMFTDLTDQATKISLMLVLKQETQIAGKDIYKVLFRVDNPKYVTGTIYYGCEFAVTAGQMSPGPNEIDFISFGKSVILSNLLSLLSIEQAVVDGRASLAHVNETRNARGLDFNSQSKAAMVEFIQTILTLAQSESSKKPKEDCEEPAKAAEAVQDSTLIGSSSGEFDFAFGDKI